MDTFADSYIKEKKLSIQRFHGTNEMSDEELLSFLYKVQPILTNNQIDLAVNDKASMTEKFDSSPCNWGINANGQFFIESANSGEVTISEAEKFNNPFTRHFYSVLHFLNSYKPFQERLNKYHEYVGAFKVSSEMFPVLTHKGNELGDIVFCSTKYNKNKLGNKGSFVVFSIKVNDVDATDQEEKLGQEVLRSSEDTEWKVYFNEIDGRLNGLIKFDISGINQWINDETKLMNSIKLLKKKVPDPEKDALKKVIDSIRPTLQAELDKYAEEINSSLGQSGGRYPVEGVVLKVNLPDGPMFIKGTSRIFHDIAEITWGTRKAISAIEKTLTGQFLKDVIGFKSDAPVVINKAVQEVAKTYNSKYQGEARENDFVLKVKEKLAQNIPSEQEMRSKASLYIQAAEKQLAETIAAWKKAQTQADPDTIDKTNDQLSDFQARLAKLKEIVLNKEYTGDAYVVYMLRILIGKRIKDYVGGNQQSNLTENLEIDETQTIRHPDEQDDPEDLFPEDFEVLDERVRQRKFEKVKMARRILVKHGFPAFSRKDIIDKAGRERNSYVIKSPKVKELMKDFNYTFNDQLGKWIKSSKKDEKKKETTMDNSIQTTDTNVEPEQKPELSTNSKKVILWVGRAQPWHKGHDVLIQAGLERVNKGEADSVMILLIKGAGTGENKETNPLDITNQINLLKGVYSTEGSKVLISDIPSTTGSIVDILVAAQKNKVVVVGWLAGSDRIGTYQAQYDRFKTDKYKDEYTQKAGDVPYPIHGDIQFISINRAELAQDQVKTGKRLTKDEKAALEKNKLNQMDIMAQAASQTDTPTITVDKISGTIARYLVTKLDFEHWYKEISPAKYLQSQSCKLAYQEIYYILGGQHKVSEQYFEHFKQELHNLFFT